jgi:hypothetical protein
MSSMKGKGEREGGGRGMKIGKGMRRLWDQKEKKGKKGK